MDEGGVREAFGGDGGGVWCGSWAALALACSAAY
jgi:hypothetical protein